MKFFGNEKTKDYIIERELTFFVNDTLTKPALLANMQTSKENLEKTSLFNFVTIQYQIINNNYINIFIYLEERWYFWPYIIFEQADRNLSSYFHQKEYDRINYGIHFVKYNFRGRGETFSVKARYGYKEQYMFLYETPQIDKKQKFGISFDFSSFRQHELDFITMLNAPVYFNDDNKYVKNEIISNIGLSYRPKWNTTHSFYIGYTNADIADTVSEMNENYFGQGDCKIETLKLQYSYNFDNRDSKIYPHKGSRYFASISQYGIPVINKKSQIFQMIKIFGQWNIPWDNNLFSTHTFKNKIAFNKNTPYYYRQALGYEMLCRGYEYYIVKGNVVQLFANELKYNILPKKVFYLNFIPFKKFNKTFLEVYINSFVDIAYVHDTKPYPNDYLENELLYSAGVGLDFVTYYDRIFRLNYTLNKEKESGIYVHFEILF